MPLHKNAGKLEKERPQEERRDAADIGDSRGAAWTAGAALIASAGLRARLGRTHFAEAAADVLPPVLDNLGRAVVSDDFILETENLTKEFAGFVAVSGVTCGSHAAPFMR